MNTSPEMSSPFINHVIDNCLLYGRQDCTQMLLQLVFQKFQESFKVIFVYLSIADSFTDVLAPSVQTRTDF